MDEFDKALKKKTYRIAFNDTFCDGARWAREWCSKHMNNLDKFQNFLDDSVEQDDEIEKLRTENQRLREALESIVKRLDAIKNTLSSECENSTENCFCMICHAGSATGLASHLAKQALAETEGE